jgi:hypothetical protein
MLRVQMVSEPSKASHLNPKGNHAGVLLNTCPVVNAPHFYYLI